jgi:methyl-accepting chemotaxis protein
VGQIARGLVIFQGSDLARREAEAAQAAAIATLAERLQSLAQGDLTVRVGNDLPEIYRAISRDFDASAQALSHAMGDIIDSSERIHSTANELRSASQDLSNRTEAQASGLNDTARSIHDHAGGARQSATIVGEARTAINGLHGHLAQSDAIIAQTAQAMDGIADSSGEISDIATMIDGIAFQTNLLALNAGVEAARAGEAGRGFAVVASEVRALAMRSAEAAKDVKDRIAKAQAEVGNGVRMVDRIATTLRDAGSQIGQISAIIEQIANHASQQATGFAQISGTIGQIDAMTQQNSAMVEQSTAAINALNDEASGLRQAVGRFRLAGRDAPPAKLRRRA